MKIDNISQEKSAGEQLFQQSWPKISKAKDAGERDIVVYRLQEGEWVYPFCLRYPSFDVDSVVSIKVLTLFNLLVESGEKPAFQIVNEDGRLECELVIL